jgi:hypothetical protein
MSSSVTPEITGIFLELGHCHLLPDCFQSVFHLTFNNSLCSVDLDSVATIITCKMNEQNKQTLLLSFWTLSIVRISTNRKHNVSETDPVSETLYFMFVEIRTMDKVQKLNSNECYTPSSEPFRKQTNSVPLVRKRTIPTE